MLSSLSRREDYLRLLTARGGRHSMACRRLGGRRGLSPRTWRLACSDAAAFVGLHGALDSSRGQHRRGGMGEPLAVQEQPLDEDRPVQAPGARCAGSGRGCRRIGEPPTSDVPDGLQVLGYAIGSRLEAGSFYQRPDTIYQDMACLTHEVKGVQCGQYFVFLIALDCRFERFDRNIHLAQIAKRLGCNDSNIRKSALPTQIIKTTDDSSLSKTRLIRQCG